MNKPRIGLKLSITTSLLTVLITASWADPSFRVARISYIQGNVSFSPAGLKEWAYIKLNRPLTTGDKIWNGNNALSELQLGGAKIRLDQYSGINFLNLNNEIAQFKLTQGNINLRVWKITPTQSFEIDTPNLAFVTKQPGDFKIKVSYQDNDTVITIRKGQATVFGEKNNLLLHENQSCRFRDTQLKNVTCKDLSSEDNFDRWGFERDLNTENAISTKYVAQNVIGYEDLEKYGQWRFEQNRGFLWTPSGLPQNWAPYRFGEWAWIQPWGWTWIDSTPWGFAPYHYGRWSYAEGVWSWAPGPINQEPIYAPALVAFFNSGKDTIGWFPLGIGDIYLPPYTASISYFDSINLNNTKLNKTFLSKVFKNPSLITYKNQQEIAGITLIPQKIFLESDAIKNSLITVTPEILKSAKMLNQIPFTADKYNILGTTQLSNHYPAEKIMTRIVIAKTQPPIQDIQARLNDVRVIPLNNTNNKVVVSLQSHGGDSLNDKKTMNDATTSTSTLEKNKVILKDKTVTTTTAPKVPPTASDIPIPTPPEKIQHPTITKPSGNEDKKTTKEIQALHEKIKDNQK